MLLTYEDYTGLGYSSIPADSFERWKAKAELTAKKYTMGRLNASTLDDNGKRGLCELAELFYSDGASGVKYGPVTSFSNGRYSESYEPRTVDELAAYIIGLYFPPDLTCRWL